MEDGLAVIADEVDPFGRDAEFFAGCQSGLGVDVTQARVKLTELSGREGILFGYAEDFFADLRWEGLVSVVEKADFEIRRGA